MIDITPPANYPSGSFAVSGADVPGRDYYVFNPGGGCGAVSVPSTIEADTDFGASCSFDEVFASIGDSAYGTWRICEYEGSSPSDEYCLDALSSDDYIWLEESEPILASSTAAVVVNSLMGQLLAMTIFGVVLLGIFRKTLGSALSN